MEYEELELIGEGSFGKVYKVRGDDGQLYAKKTLDPQTHILKNVDIDELTPRFSRPQARRRFTATDRKEGDQ